MIIHKIMDRMLAGQMLLFDGWIQIDNEEILDVWWTKEDLYVVVQPHRPYGIYVFTSDSNFEPLTSERYFCPNISAFSHAVLKINKL